MSATEVTAGGTAAIREFEIGFVAVAPDHRDLHSFEKIRDLTGIDHFRLQIAEVGLDLEALDRHDACRRVRPVEAPLAGVDLPGKKCRKGRASALLVIQRTLDISRNAEQELSKPGGKADEFTTADQARDVIMQGM